MFLVSLTYTSEMTGSMDFMDILEVSRVNNERDGITGVLLLFNDNVVQCLEGSREVVSKTYARIVGDKRHMNPLLLDYRILSARAFSKWSMGYVQASSVTRPTLLKYAVTENFEPRSLSGESCLGMLTELTQEVGMV
ncbi:MAG: BLUF domain-containing protein [Gammaproteobacteria bacterium]